MVMAYKPAPIQISALGWLNTTGLEQIDYYLTDEFCWVEQDKSSLFSEELVAPAGPQLCFSPLNKSFYEGEEYYENQLSGTCLLGAFSNFDKITDEMLLAWGEIIRDVPGSRMLIKDTTDISSRRRALHQRINRLLPADIVRCIELEGASTDYLQRYRSIDIALDTYPYTGGATVCDALAMGVPIVSIKGDSPSRRFGSSILFYAGVRELIADNLKEYTKKAAALAMDKPKQKQLKQYLHNNFWKSPLTDIDGYKQRMEDLYCDMVIRAVNVFK